MTTPSQVTRMETPRLQSPSSNITSPSSKRLTEPLSLQIHPDKRTHQAKVSVFLTEAFRNGSQGCDLKLMVENDFILVHWGMMAAHSETIRAQYQKMLPGIPGVEKIAFSEDQISMTGLRAAVEYVYIGEVRLTIEMLKHVIQAAGFLKIRKLQQLCETFLKRAANDERYALYCLTFCYKYYVSSSCRDDVLLICCEQFQPLRNQRDFSNLHVEVICAMLCHDCLSAPSEMDVFDAAMKWLKQGGAGFDPRLLYAERILRCVRFTLMSHDDLIKCASRAKNAGVDHALPSKLKQASWYKMCQEKGRTDLTCPEALPRQQKESTPLSQPTPDSKSPKSKTASEWDSISNRTVPKEALASSTVGLSDPVLRTDSGSTSGSSATNLRPQYIPRGPLVAHSSGQLITKSGLKSKGPSAPGSKKKKAPKVSQKKAISYSGPTSPKSQPSKKSRTASKTPDTCVPPEKIPIVIPVFPGQDKLEKAAQSRPAYPFKPETTEKVVKRKPSKPDTIPLTKPKTSREYGSKPRSQFTAAMTDSGTFEIRHSQSNSVKAPKKSTSSQSSISNKSIPKKADSKASTESKSTKTEFKSLRINVIPSKKVQGKKLEIGKGSSASGTSEESKDVKKLTKKVDMNEARQSIESLIRNVKKQNEAGSKIKAKKPEYSNDVSTKRDCGDVKRFQFSPYDDDLTGSDIGPMSDDGMTLCYKEGTEVIEKTADGKGDTVFRNSFEKCSVINEINMTGNKKPKRKSNCSKNKLIQKTSKTPV